MSNDSPPKVIEHSPSGTSGTSQESEERNVRLSYSDRLQRSQGGLVVVEEFPESGLIKYTYVDSPAEVPEGVDLEVGPREGLRYDDDSREFLEHQHENTLERLDEDEYSEQEIEEAIAHIQRHDEMASEAFETAFEAASGAGADIKSATHRVKGVGSVLQKVAGNRSDVDEDEYDSPRDLTDMHGSQVTVDSLEAAEDTFQALLDNDDLDIEKSKDHFETKDNPYRAHHVIIDMGDDVYSEIQIKEKRMSQIASASHSLTYKTDTAPVDEMKTVEDIAELEGMQEPLEECLVKQADLREGLISEEEADCDEEAWSVIREFFVLEGYVDNE